MARSQHRKRSPSVPSARGGRGGGQGQAVPRPPGSPEAVNPGPAEAASASPAVGNSVPAQREAPPAPHQPALPQEGKPGDTLSGDGAQNDVLKFSFTDRGDEKSLSVVGLDRLTKQICLIVLCVGVVLAMIAGAVIGVIYLLDPTNSSREKAFAGLGIAVTTVCVCLGTWVKRRIARKLKGWWKRRHARSVTGDSGHGEP
jgi:hypothetical protein